MNDKARPTNEADVPIRHYSTCELARLYGVSDKTLLKWMRPFAEAIGQRQGRFYTAAQIRIIFEKLGAPA